MRKLVPCALAVLVLAALGPAEARAQQPAPRLDQLMSAEELAATGVSRLTAAERAQLEAWLARYTATVSAVVRGMGVPAAPGVPAAAAQPAAPGATLPTPQASPELPKLPRTAPRGAHVFRSADGGTFIMLQDGTMWEIFYPDRPRTAAWRVGDFVSVHQRPARIGEFTFSLVNAAQSTAVAARFAGFIRTEQPADTTGNR